MMYTVALVAAASIATALYFIVTRRRRVPQLHVDLDDFPNIETALPQIAGLTGGSVHEGNEATVFQNGALFDALLEAI